MTAVRPYARVVNGDAVLELVAQGLTDREIQARLHVSHNTVRRRVAEFERDHGCSNRFQAGVAWARLHPVDGSA